MRSLGARPRHLKLRPACAQMLVLVGLVVVAAVAVTALSRAQWAALNRAAFSQPAPPASQPARRGKVFVRWSMGGGLCNQLVSHINGLTISLAMGADAAILPHTKHRENFNHTRSTHKQDGGQWKASHIDTLLDLKTMRREWQARGLELYEGPLSQAARARAPWRNCIVTGADAFAPPPGSKYLVADLATVLSRLRLALGDVWQEHGPKACVLVEAGNLFGALNTSSTGNLTAAARAGLRFEPRVEELAAKAAQAMEGAFNGVHLRLEPDMGLDPEVAIPQYMSAMQAMRFNASTPLYIASGLLTYNDTATFDGVARRLCGAGLCSRAVAKEHLLPPQDLQGLHSEQLALLDLLALTRAAALVGTNVSTLSLFARDYRTIRGGGTDATVRLLGDA